MCGIFGCLNSNISLGLAEKCLDTLQHRGPDGSGLWHEDGIILGHRRLAILDLSDNGKQPMSYANERYWITFNGEIYNFLELRNELYGLGYHFKSDSDTEVILAAFAEWRESCLNKFNGMWAFAIWDKLEKRLFMARDRFGVKPLFYTRIKENGIAFASEMKALTPLMEEVGADKDIFELYRAKQHYENQPYCLIKGIMRLLGGTYAWIGQNGKMVIETWWDTLNNLPKVPKDYGDQIDAFRELFLDSCKKRMRSDVTIGTALSGGLDSSATISAMAYLSKNDIDSRASKDWQHAYVASFPGSLLDETKYADMVAHHLNIKKTLVEIEPEQEVTNLYQYMYFFEELWSANPISMMLLYKKERQDGVVVSIDGHASDELFGGYNFDMIHALEDTKGNLAEIISTLQAYYDMDYRKEHAGIKDKLAAAKLYCEVISKSKVKRILGHTEFDGRQKSNENWSRLDTLNKRLYIDTHETILPTLLRNYDRYSMASGVEIRMPFLDYRLVQFAFALGWKSKVRNGYTKAIVRDAVAPFLPDEVTYRKSKIGWMTPIGEIMQGSAREWFLDICHSIEFDNCDLIDPQDTRDKIMRTISGNGNDSFRLGNAAWQALQPFIWEQAMLKRGNRV